MGGAVGCDTGFDGDTTGRWSLGISKLLSRGGHKF
jgi:hypothetical protein